MGDKTWRINSSTLRLILRTPALNHDLIIRSLRLGIRLSLPQLLNLARLNAPHTTPQTHTVRDTVQSKNLGLLFKLSSMKHCEKLTFVPMLRTLCHQYF